MHGWRGHTDEASSGRQKRKRLLELASGSLSAAAGAIGNALCGAVGPAAADSAAAGQQQQQQQQQQQPRKRVTGSIMRLGMPGSGGSLPTTGACASAAGELMMQQPTGGASRPQRQGAGKDPGIAIAAAAAAAADRLDSDTCGGDQLIRGSSDSSASAGAKQQGHAAFRSNPFSTCQQEEDEEDEEGDCLQGFSLLPSTSNLLLPVSGAPAPALRHITGGIASTQRHPQHQYNVAARHPQQQTGISGRFPAQAGHPQRGLSTLDGGGSSARDNRSEEAAAAAVVASRPPAGRPPTGRQQGGSSTTSTTRQTAPPAGSSLGCIDAAPRSPPAGVLDLQRAVAFCEGLGSPLVSAALSRLAHIDGLPTVCGTPHAGRDPLQVTAAALYLLLERAGASPAEARSPDVLLTALWLLESFSSQYRCSAAVCLRDYTCYTDVAVPEELQLEPKELLPHLLALQLALLTRADWRLRMAEEELAAVCSAFVHGRQELRHAFAAALHSIKVQVESRQRGRARRCAQAEERARHALAARQGVQLHMGQLQLSVASAAQQQQAAGSSRAEAAGLRQERLDRGFWKA